MCFHERNPTLHTGRYSHTATLLPNGKVLVAGGSDGTTLTLLLDGRVLTAGGAGYAYTTELYDPATGAWTVAGPMNTARFAHTATLLPNGKVLVAGGSYPGGGYPFAAGELYDSGLAPSPAWQPQILTINSPLQLGSSLVLTDAQFRGISGGSSGNTQDSPTDYPLVQLRSLESGQTTFLPCTDWTTNSFASLPVWPFPPGYALATVFLNGVPGQSSIVNISVPVPTPPRIIGASTPADGPFQFSFTNSVGASFRVLAATNLSLPATNWTMLGGCVETSPGYFQFTDPQPATSPQRFYRLRSL